MTFGEALDKAQRDYPSWVEALSSCAIENNQIAIEILKLPVEKQILHIANMIMGPTEKGDFNVTDI
jgi:hypothetical protein